MVHAVVGLVQLVALGVFAGGVYMLNQMAPKRMAARVFKLHWLLGTLGVGLAVAFLLASPINLPARIQTTPVVLVKAHDVIRETCQAHLKAMRFDDAYQSISKRTKTAELVGEHAQKAKESKTSLARLLSPLLNTVLFHTGVAIAFVPALLRLLLLLWQKRRLGARGQLDAQFESRERREWAVFLPIMNVVTLLSLCVSPTFYFFLEPARATRCVYTSGHWYTFTCTCLTFAIVITHLYRNRAYCRRSMQLLSWYFAWACAYLAAAIMVLKQTQTFYHDDMEAVDGIKQALPAFTVFIGVLIVYQFLTASARDIQVADAADALSETADSAAASTLSSRIPAASAKAKKILGLVGDATSSKAKKVLGLTDETDEQPAADQAEPKKQSSSKKKAAGSNEKKDSPVAAATAAATDVDADEEDAVLVNASDSEPFSSASESSSQAPSAPPMAPPMAPPPPAPTAPTSSGKRTDIKIPQPKAQPKAAAVDPQTALLEGIKRGVALKHAKTNARGAASRSASAAPTGLMGALQAKFAQTRLAIDGEKEEANEDDEWTM